MTNKINLNVSFTNENLFHIISELLKTGIPNGKLQIDLATLDPEKIESLKTRLTQLNIPFSSVSKNEEDENATDDDPEDMSLGSFKMSAKEEAQKEEQNGSAKIDDQYIANYFNNRKQKMHLTELIDKYKIEINVEKKRVELTGPQSKVDKFKEEILKIKYQKSVLMNKSEARCLKNIQYIKTLKERYETTIKVMPEGDKSRIIIYGVDQTKIENCREQLEKVIDKIILLIELDTEHEIEGEVQEILKFLQEKYQKKYETAFKKKRIECEIGKTEDPYNKKVSIFFFVKCNEDHFNKIRDYINKEMAALCVLNIYPKKEKKIQVKKSDGTIDDKVGVFGLKSGHYLLIGKEKHMKTFLTFLPSIETIENQVDYFKLRFKKLPHPANNTLRDEASRGVDVSFKPDPYLNVIITNKSRVKVILDLLEKFKKHLSTVITMPDQSVSLNLTKSVDKESTAASSEKRDNKSILSTIEERILVEDEPPIKTYDPKNENKTFQKLDTTQESDMIDCNSPEYLRIQNLLEAGGQYKIDIDYVIKLITEDLWEKYESSRRKYHTGTVAEYLLFYKTQERPDDLKLEDKEIKDLEENLVEYCKKEYKVFKDDEGRNEIMAGLVLVHKNKNNKILAIYPAYIVNFNFQY